MKYKFKERRKFKHIRNNIFDIPTGELDTPLTNGHEVLEFLMQVANKQRYQFKARGRGSRKQFGSVYDLPIENAEKIALYHETRDRVAFMEHQESKRSKSAGNISWLLRDIKTAITKHNNNYDNDLEIDLKTEEQN